MIRFEYPLLLWLLMLLPVWIAVFVWTLRLRKRASASFVSPNLFQRIARAHSEGRLRVKALLWAVAWGLLVMGAAGPQVGTRMEEVKRAGVDVMLAVDVSTSMLCQDIAPTRLENTKQEIQRFIGGLKGDRVGIVAFAGNSVVLCPLTTDYGAAKLLVRVLQPDLVSDPGTALADAIEAARKSFNAPDVKSRVIVIITDGEDHEERAVEAAKAAADEGIRIYTIGMGSPGGGPIPIKDGKGNDAGFKRDRSGGVVVSRLNEVLLQRVAETGGGRYLRATQSAQELDAIWSDLSSMEKSEFGQKQYAGFENRFQYLVFPAFLILLAEFFVSERKDSLKLRRVKLPFVKAKPSQ